MQKPARKLALLLLATLLAALIASVPATRAQSASFLISQHGKPVGTASYNITASADGYDSTALVHVNMQGLNYAISEAARLSAARQLRHVELSAIVNGSAVQVTAAPEAAAGAAPTLRLSISANGHANSTHLAPHTASVFLPDFDPGALETLLSLAALSNNRDLWAIIPKQAGSVVPIQLATYANQQGTLDGKPIVVHHLVATIAGSETDLFSSPQNHLLQAEFPAQGFALVRKSFVLTPPVKPAAPPVEYSPPASQ